MMGLLEGHEGYYFA